MATDLIVPDGLAPSNLHLKASIKARYISGDLYDICGRMNEIDQRLFVVELDDEDTDRCAYAIMEHCDDGIERLVFRVPELDGRVLERLRKIMAMDLQDRIKMLEKDEYKWEQEREDNMHEKLYEELGRPMLTELAKCGFIDRPISYPTTGVTGGRGSLAKS